MAIEPTFRGFNILHKTVEVNGLDIFYREAGSKNALPIFLLHGFPTSSHMFRNLIPALSDKFHLIAPDYPGFGNSSMPKVDEFDYTFDNIAEIIDFHLLDTGHFALEEDGGLIASLIRNFLDKNVASSKTA